MIRSYIKAILLFIIMFTSWEKTYSVATGQLRIRIDYDLTWSTYNLDFDVIDIGKLRYGYEDDDLLTFYPNTLKLSFDDMERKYYDVLKLSLGEYNNNFPDHFLKYGGVTLWLNGQIKFKGYIDPLTLHYDDARRTVDFESIDLTKALRDMSVQNLYADGELASLGSIVHKIYQKVYPDLSSAFYSDNNFSNGIYFKHDWQFTGRKTLTDTITRDWRIINEMLQTYFIWHSTGIFGADRPADTYADLIKLLSLQFGAVIGSADYNRIYIAKRFASLTADFINLDELILGNYKKYIHLPPLVGARNRNTWNNETRTYTAGSVEVINEQGDLKYKNLVKEFNTYIGSFVDAGSSGTMIFVTPSLEYPVTTDILDPALNQRDHIALLLCRWFVLTRIRPKDKIELSLEGTDYNLHNSYSITNPGNPTLKFRPMEIESDLLKNRSEMKGVEV